MHSKNINNLPADFTPPHILSGMSEDSAILVGFSGGSDSTALLHLLTRYAKCTGARIYAAHLNHGIRGEEADRDEAFCKALAKRLDVTFFSKKVAIPEISKQTGESVETAARRVRYEFFADVMRDNGISILATAHNADDNLETVIFNLTRGSGLNGICGIPECRPCEEGIVIRPILAMEKSDILSYCKENGLDFVTDSTNADTEYTRNKIRSEIIPVMKQINSGAVKNAYRASRTLHDDSLCLEDLATDLTDGIDGEYAIELKKLCGIRSAIANRALIHMYSKASDGHTLEAVHVNALRELSAKAVPHSSVSLPNGFEGIIEDRKLYIKRKEDKAQFSAYSLPLREGSNFISQTNCEIFIGNSHNTKNIYKKSILLSIDSAKIKGELVARSRISGDKIKVNGMHKSLKKLACDKKIPLDLRQRLPVLCDENGVLALPLVAIRDGARCKGKSEENISKIEIHVYLY